MDYYTTLATVIPLLYVALALEGRLKTPIKDEHGDPFGTVSRAFARLSVLVVLPLLEVGLLVGIERSERLAVVDGNAPPALILVGLVLVCPPIWEQISEFVPEQRHDVVRRSLEGLVVGCYAASVLTGWLG